MAWEERDTKKNSNMWIPAKDGDELVGEITEVKQGQFGMQYLICKENDEEVLTPSHKVLQNRMEGLTVGTAVKIVYTGTELPTVKGQNGMKMYKVFVNK
jgi:hypothetical protein